jgi:hypothetical protein
MFIDVETDAAGDVVSLTDETGSATRPSDFRAILQSEEDRRAMR